VLKDNGYTVIQRDRVLKIISRSNAKTKASRSFRINSE